VIRVQDLAIEVAGRSLLEGGAFSLQPGDKAGLVGVNGAGKTSLLQVLAGEGDPLRGEISRRGSLGYMPQDPRLATDGDGSALAYVLSGRGLDRAAAARAAFRSAMGTSSSGGRSTARQLSQAWQRRGTPCSPK